MCSRFFLWTGGRKKVFQEMLADLKRLFIFLQGSFGGHRLDMFLVAAIEVGGRTIKLEGCLVLLQLFCNLKYPQTNACNLKSLQISRNLFSSGIQIWQIAVSYLQLNTKVRSESEVSVLFLWKPALYIFKGLSVYRQQIIYTLQCMIVYLQSIN